MLDTLSRLTTRQSTIVADKDNILDNLVMLNSLELLDTSATDLIEIDLAFKA